MYPSISRYIETIQNPEKLFRTLGVLNAIDGYDGMPQMSSGNFGTVFKVRTDRGVVALKCFTRHQRGRLSAYRQIASEISPSRYMVDYQYLEDEIYVFDEDHQGNYYPVVVMDWVDGVTLGKAVERSLRVGDHYGLSALVEKFDEMAEWLLEQPFAHNDLKPDNIMVRHDNGEVVLVDYDGMFVPGMAGEPAREFGTPPFQSPNRMTAPFDRHVDNYSIAYIRKALNVLLDSPERFSPQVLVEFADHELEQIEQTHTIYGSRYQFLDSAVGNARIYKAAEKYGFVTERGVPLTEAVFDSAQSFSSDDGLAAICKDGRWGYIDNQGCIVVEPQFEGCTSFAEGVAAVCRGGKWGFIDAKGVVISKFIYDNAWSPRFGRAMVCRKGKYGFVGTDTKTVVPLRYDYARNFTREGIACVMVDGKWGYIDRQGKWYLRPVYDHAQSFRDGMAAVELNEREFFINFK